MNTDKNHVVIKNGERATGLLSEQEAQTEAARLKQQIVEQTGQKSQESTVQVKQNIFG